MGPVDDLAQTDKYGLLMPKPRDEPGEMVEKNETALPDCLCCHKIACPKALERIKAC